MYDRWRLIASSLTLSRNNFSALADAVGVAGREGRPFELQWICQIAKGLEFLHGLPPPLGPLLHTDLRAGNVLLDSSYNAKISKSTTPSMILLL